MGEAKRRAAAKGLTVVDGGQTPKKFEMLAEITVVIPRAVRDAIDQLYTLVQNHYPTRNDFLEDLLKEGLKSALSAQAEALKAFAAKQQQYVPPGMEGAAERLEALRFEQAKRDGTAPTPREPEDA